MELLAVVFIAGGVIGAKWEWFLALAAFASGVWQRVRMALDWVWGLVVVTNEVEWDTVLVILAYMDSLGKIPRKQRGRNFFTSNMRHVRPLDRAQRVMMINRTHNDIIFFYKRKPVFYHYAPGEDSHCTFSYFRGTVDWKSFLWEVVQWEEAQKKQTDEDSEERTASRFCIQKMYGNNAAYQDAGDDHLPSPTRAARTRPAGLYQSGEVQQWIPIHWKVDDIGESHTASSLELLSLREELIAAVNEARFWYTSEAWYKERGIPWRRSFGFYGDPGTGKTSLARGIAEDLGIPVFAFDLASMGNREFNMYWERATHDAPCMILLEDVDAVFEGRQNTSTRADALTFDCLLNCIDGAKRPDGMLLVITTNNLDKLDPALRRPGRMDRVVQFLPLDYEGRLKIAQRIVEDQDIARKLAMEGADDPAAEFQERCFRLALDVRYKDAV